MENKGTSISTVLISLLAGAAIGAALGILYAPDSGKNTRDKLAFQIDKLREKLQQMLKDLVNNDNLESNQAKADGERVVSETVLHVEKLISEVDALQNKLKANPNK